MRTLLWRIPEAMACAAWTTLLVLNITYWARGDSGAPIQANQLVITVVLVSSLGVMMRVATLAVVTAIVDHERPKWISTGYRMRVAHEEGPTLPRPHDLHERRHLNGSKLDWK